MPKLFKRTSKRSTLLANEWRQLVHRKIHALAIMQVHVRGTGRDEEFLRFRLPWREVSVLLSARLRWSTKL